MLKTTFPSSHNPINCGRTKLLIRIELLDDRGSVRMRATSVRSYIPRKSGKSRLVLSKHRYDAYRRHQVVQGVEADADGAESVDDPQLQVPEVEREDVAHHQDGYHDLSAERAI